MLAGSRLHAADVIENKSSTFSTQLNNRTDSTSNDSAIAEKIRAQRAAIDARDNRNTATAQIKSSATQNNCDNDLRKCINNTCGANYKKCETDSDTTFSDKLNACRKNTTCTAHEFTLFTNEIKEDKKQAISLALYNNVLDCGNSYNDCIIQQCGPKFNKCLAKSAGDKAINACKTIAQNCTEADSGLVGRVGNVFGIVRVDAEKQIKTDEAKLQSLRDQMRNSCRTLGALFDDRSLDCVFTANFFAGDDKTHPMASKKLYAGSLFDCTPDWFGIDITTFKENAYRATRAQSAASAAMLGSGVGTAVGALTSGAISRAIDTKKAKDALEKACEDKGQVLKDGKCVDKEPDDTDEDSADEEDENNDNDTETAENGEGSDSQPTDNSTNNSNDKTICEESGGEYNETTGCRCRNANQLTYAPGNKSCVCMNSNLTFDKDANKCVLTPIKNNNEGIQNAIDKESQKQVQACTDSGGTWNDKKKSPCSCSKQKGLTDDIKGFTCKCSQNGYIFQNGKCTKQTSSATTTNQQSASATNKDTEVSTQTTKSNTDNKDLENRIRKLQKIKQKVTCNENGGKWDDQKEECIKKSSTTTQQAVETRPMTKEEVLEQTLSMTAANQSMMYLNSINEIKSFCDVANKKCGFVYVNQNTKLGALFCCKVDKIEQTNDGYSIQGQECQDRTFANIKDPNKFANKYSIASCSPQEFPDLY